MYRKILVALDETKADDSLIPHVAKLAKLTGAELIVFHVSEGWMARNQAKLDLADSEEMKNDRLYLESVAERLRKEGVNARPRLGAGNPPDEVLKAAEAEQCDLIAMTTHGHRLIGDLFLGSTIEQVRHASFIPLLIVRSRG